MSYMRDSDRRTRGVGAIAATDNVSGARRMRQAQVHQATRRRDLRMSQIAQGALGLVPIGPGGPVHWNEGQDTTYNPPPVPTKTAAPPPMYVPPPPVMVATAPVYLPPPSVISPPATIPPPVIIAPPVMMPPVSAPPASTVTVSGGDSGVVLTTPTTTPIAITPVPDLPDIPDAVPDNTVRNLAIAGGLALAAYLYFRKGSP